jgi:hypothetical protein
MMYFKIHLTQHDGVHEHTSQFVAKGRSQQTVSNRIEREQLYEYGEDKPNSMLSYGDGETAVSKYWLTEIPKEHFDLLVEHNYLNVI